MIPFNDFNEDFEKTFNQIQKTQRTMFKFVAAIIAIIFILIIGYFAINFTDTSSRIAKSKAEIWAYDQGMTSPKISCNNSGECNVTKENGKFISLKCPVLVGGSCIVRVSSIDFQE